MRKKDNKDRDSIKLIVFRNGFIKEFRSDDSDDLFRVRFWIPARKHRKRPSLKKFSFRPPLPKVPF